MNIKYQLVGILMLLSILGIVNATIDLQNPIDGQYINNTNVTIEVTTNLTVQNATLILDGGSPQNLAYKEALSAYTLNLTDLSQGLHTLNVTINGTTVNETANFTFIVDTVYPVVTNSTPAMNTTMPKNFRIIANITENNNNTVQAIITPNGGSAQAPITLTSIGGNTYESPTITQNTGNYTYTLNVTDLANNTVMTAPINFSVDGDAPVVTNSLPGTDYLINEGYTINATVTDNKGVASVVATVLNTSTGTSNEYTLNHISGDFYETGVIPVVEDAALTYNITATDIYGNAVTTTSTNYYIDITSPIITINLPAPISPTNYIPIIGSTTLYFNFSVNEMISMSEAFVDTINVTLNSSGQSFNGTVIGLAEDLHTLNITVEDEAGNIANKSLNFVVDTSAPVISNISPANDSVIAENINISALVVDYNVSNVQVALFNESGFIKTVNMTGNETSYYNAELLNLVPGTYTFVITAIDTVQNSATLNVSNITVPAPVVDTTAPKINVTNPLNGTTVPEGVIFVANVTDESNIASVQAIITGPANHTINLTYNATTEMYENDSLSLADGAYSFVVNATDDNGNENSSEVVNFVVDGTAPVISNISPANDSVIAENINISALVVDYNVS
ncbi:hypothetical protein J2127_001723, partial [Methanococcus voltae]|uniref:hypothetical protein n=1 Tax=Methanococcus voltae TaxID=2188 RepID=UPI001AE47756